MTSLYKLLFLSVFVLTSVSVVHSQNLPTIAVSEIKKIERYPIAHLGVYIDRKVIFKLSNPTGQRLVVFGTYVEGELNPIRYHLRFNKESKMWEYPTSDNKPLAWKRESFVNKHEKVLDPGDFLIFSSVRSSETDCGESYKVTVQVKIGKSKKTQEIVSEEFAMDLCK
jgi:hypothetical protein